MKGKIKTTGSFKGKSNKLGGGGRFAQLKSKLSGKVSNPGGVAAMIGRKKYGAKKMTKMATTGKKKSMSKGFNEKKYASMHKKVFNLK